MSPAGRTRAALLNAALEMFATDGYNATTTAGIARRAGVSEMTLFRHFPTKASLVVDDPYDPLIAAAVGARPVDEPPMLAAIRGIRVAWGSVPASDTESIQRRLRIVATTPTLRGATAEAHRATEDAITAALMARGVARGQAVIVAAAVLAGLDRALLDWSLSDLPNPASAIALALRTLADGSDANVDSGDGRGEPAPAGWYGHA